MGGKSSTPAAPDYVGQANATAAGNLAAARSQTQANRINQTTPYGSIKYTQGGFDQAGYDAAMQRYLSGLSQPVQNTASLAGGGSKLDRYMDALSGAFGVPSSSQTGGGAQGGAPNRADFMTNPDQWSSEITLDPAQQALLDQQNKTSLGLAGLQDQAFGRVSDAYSQPFDMSGLQEMQTNLDPNTGMDAWDRATDLIRQRQNPQLDQQQAALDAKLANQGLTAGSEGWGIQQSQFGKTRNDADIAAQLAGLQAQQQFFNQASTNANLKNTSRQQQLTERSTLRNMPLQELNSLRAGSTVTNPTFTAPGQQGQTTGADLLGASNAQYTNALNSTNAQNAQSAGTTNAFLGLGGAAISAFF
jgi:hypothetical protein